MNQIHYALPKYSGGTGIGKTFQIQGRKQKEGMVDVSQAGLKFNKVISKDFQAQEYAS